MEIFWDDVEALSEDIFAGKPILFSAPDLAYDAFNRFIKKPFGERVTLFTKAVNKIELAPNAIPTGPTGQTGMNPGSPSYISQVDLENLFSRKNGQPGCLSGITFAVHGKLRNYANRYAIESKILGLGGSISKSVDFSTKILVASSLNNCTKIRDAIKFGVPIITENQFIHHFCGGRAY